jgi:multidrug efflux pump subunit AcrA (membrane-fusion protein)
LSACESSADPQILGTFERYRLELTATANEPITELLVREGDRVTADQVLARQDPEAIAARLDQARSRVAEARSRLQAQRRKARAIAASCAESRTWSSGVC